MRKAIGGAVSLAVAAVALVAAGSAADAVTSPTTSIVWTDPGPEPAGNRPALLPTATCALYDPISFAAPVRYWFGVTVEPYGSLASGRPIELPIGGSSNSFEEIQPIAGGPAKIVNAADNRGQPTQFHVGEPASRLFVVPTASGFNQLTWTLTSPGVLGGTYRIDFSPGRPAACAASVPAMSASIQQAGQFGPAVTMTVLSETTDRVTGRLISAKLGIRLDPARPLVSACSPGGVPLAPKVLWGYNDTDRPLWGVGLPFDPPKNLAGIPAVNRVRADTFSGSRYVRTFRSYRKVLDAQLPFTITERGVPRTLTGFASTEVVADVIGQCQFGTTVVKSGSTWWTNSGGPTLVTVDNEGEHIAVPRIDLFIGPGGVRYR